MGYVVTSNGVAVLDYFEAAYHSYRLAITLQSGVKTTSGDGTQSNPYNI